jgi:hypothetical protein
MREVVGSVLTFGFRIAHFLAAIVLWSSCCADGAKDGEAERERRKSEVVSIKGSYVRVDEVETGLR